MYIHTHTHTHRQPSLWFLQDFAASNPLPWAKETKSILILVQVQSRQFAI